MGHISFYSSHSPEIDRVLPEGKGRNFLVYQSQGYSVRQVPLNGEQIRNVYGVAVSVIGLLCSIGYLFD
jgi:hypothetical protein